MKFKRQTSSRYVRNPVTGKRMVVRNGVVKTGRPTDEKKRGTGGMTTLSLAQFNACNIEEADLDMEGAIKALLKFCAGNKRYATYYEGLVRDASRGSYVEGLNTWKDTVNFLNSLNWMPVSVADDIQHNDDTYWQASVPENCTAVMNVSTLAHLNKDDVTVKRADHDGDCLVTHLPPNPKATPVISCIIDGSGMLTTWYPGEFTSYTPTQISDDDTTWGPNWAVKHI